MASGHHHHASNRWYVRSMPATATSLVALTAFFGCQFPSLTPRSRSDARLSAGPAPKEKKNFERRSVVVPLSEEPAPGGGGANTKRRECSCRGRDREGEGGHPNINPAHASACGAYVPAAHAAPSRKKYCGWLYIYTSSLPLHPPSLKHRLSGSTSPNQDTRVRRLPYLSHSALCLPTSGVKSTTIRA